jgi:membrane associated rhomboid family serine protease
MSLTQSIFQDLRHRFQYGDIGIRFILMQSGIFLVLNFIHLFCWIGGREDWFSIFLRQIAASSDWSVLMFRPWTLLTYMVSHVQIFHFISNMLMLYFASSVYNLYMREKDWMLVYFFGGIGGYITFWLVVHFIPAVPNNQAQILGASASIFSLLFASVALNPDHEVHLFGVWRVKLLYLSLGLLFLGLFLSPSGNAGGYFSHLGGSLAGYSYMRLRQSGIDLFSLFRRKHKKSVSSNQEERQVEKQSKTSADEEKVDRLLDKINRSGYNSLTEAEKKFLQEYSKRQS